MAWADACGRIIEQAGSDMFSLGKDDAAQIWPDLERLWLDEVKIRACGTQADGSDGRTALERPTVLIVDDDDAVRDCATAILPGSGYRVLAVASPSEALDHLGEASTVDLMFTDIVLPEIDGFKLAELAQRRHPTLRVLFTSGYPERFVDRSTTGDRLLSKPYRSAQLEQAVREATAHRSR
jgi:CheY-like chemotaxis protein